MGEKYRKKPEPTLEEEAAGEAALTQRLAISLEENQDPVTAAERAAGVGRNQLDPLAELGLVFRYNQMKADKAEWVGDTFLSMDWSYLLKVLLKQGFEQAYAHDFQELRYGNTEEFIVWVKRDKGYLMCANSYSEKTSVNNAHLYYELALPSTDESLTKRQREFIWKLHGSRNAIIVNGAIAPSLLYEFDAREGLVRELQTLEEEVLPTNAPWEHIFPGEFYRLQLYDSVSAKLKEADDYRENLRLKNMRTISMLPNDIQKMLGVTQ